MLEKWAPANSRIHWSSWSEPMKTDHYLLETTPRTASTCWFASYNPWHQRLLAMWWMAIPSPWRPRTTQGCCYMLPSLPGHLSKRNWSRAGLGELMAVYGPLSYKIVRVMMASSNENILRFTGLLCGEFTDPGFGVFFDLRLNKRLSKQSWGWWFETPSWSLWRHCNVEAHRC